jgi:hypothetical protein
VSWSPRRLRGARWWPDHRPADRVSDPPLHSIQPRGIVQLLLDQSLVRPAVVRVIDRDRIHGAKDGVTRSASHRSETFELRPILLPDFYRTGRNRVEASNIVVSRQLGRPNPQTPGQPHFAGIDRYGPIRLLTEFKSPLAHHEGAQGRSRSRVVGSGRRADDAEMRKLMRVDL